MGRVLPDAIHHITAFIHCAVLCSASPWIQHRCRGEQPHLWYDDRVVWLADKFPKARQHWLVLARAPRLGGPRDLSAAAGDVELLEHMLVRGLAVAAAVVVAAARVDGCTSVLT